MMMLCMLKMVRILMIVWVLNDDAVDVEDVYDNNDGVYAEVVKDNDYSVNVEYVYDNNFCFVFWP